MLRESFQDAPPQNDRRQYSTGMLDVRSMDFTLCSRVLAMTDELILQIKNNFAAVQSANEAASQWLAQRTTLVDLQYFASLAIEEIATNCIKYGYDDAKEHIIEVKLLLSAKTLVVTVEDDGHAFNPLEVPTPDTSLPAEDRPIGGLGLYLLRQLSDRMEYTREQGKNRLTLQKTVRGGL